MSDEWKYVYWLLDHYVVTCSNISSYWVQGYLLAGYGFHRRWSTDFRYIGRNRYFGLGLGDMFSCHKITCVLYDMQWYYIYFLTINFRLNYLGCALNNNSATKAYIAYIYRARVPTWYIQYTPQCTANKGTYTWRISYNNRYHIKLPTNAGEPFTHTIVQPQFDTTAYQNIHR